VPPTSSERARSRLVDDDPVSATGATAGNLATSRTHVRSTAPSVQPRAERTRTRLKTWSIGLSGVRARDPYRPIASRTRSNTRGAPTPHRPRAELTWVNVARRRRLAAIPFPSPRALAAPRRTRPLFAHEGARVSAHARRDVAQPSARFKVPGRTNSETRPIIPHPQRRSRNAARTLHVARVCGGLSAWREAGAPSAEVAGAVL
jgi:hypothetical protein